MAKRYHCGGAEYAAFNLAREMAELDANIDVFTTSYDGKDCIEDYGFAVVHRFGTLFKVETSSLSLGYFTKAFSPNLDLIHVHFDMAPGPLAGYLCAKRKEIPLVVTYHGDWIEGYGNALRRIGVILNNRLIVDRILSNADKIISPSLHYVNESKFLRKYSDKVAIIPNGIDAREFDISLTKEQCRSLLGLPKDEDIILFFGHMSPYKSPDLLIKAFSRVLMHRPEVELVLCGSGAMIPALKAFAKDLGLERNIRFIGYVDDRDKALYFRAADLFCLPSTMNTEVLPLALLEASASGLPSVVSDLETFKYIIDNEYNGLFSKKGDSESLSRQILYLLENPERRREIGKNARKSVEDLSWKKVAEMTRDLYLDVI